jgi:hypothetical protein
MVHNRKAHAPSGRPPLPHEMHHLGARRHVAGYRPEGILLANVAGPVKGIGWMHLPLEEPPHEPAP